MLQPRASSPPSAKNRHWITSTAASASSAGPPPSRADSRMPPPMCPLDPVPGMVKLIIWAANTKAPPTAIMGSFWLVSWLRCTRAALTASAPALTAHMVSPTAGESKASDICMVLFSSSKKAVSIGVSAAGHKKAMRAAAPPFPGRAVAFMADKCKQAGRCAHRQPCKFVWKGFPPFRSAKTLFLRARRPFLRRAPGGTILYFIIANSAGPVKSAGPLPPGGPRAQPKPSTRQSQPRP